MRGSQRIRRPVPSGDKDLKSLPLRLAQKSLLFLPRTDIIKIISGRRELHESGEKAFPVD